MTGRLLACKRASALCAKRPRWMRPRALRSTGPTSRRRRSVGNSTSRPSVRWLHVFNRFPAYRWSAQTGIYIDVNHHRAGGGRKLYTQLLGRLTERGYRQAFAGITQPNAASNGFHRSFGFQDAGLYRRVEWKHDSWHDVAWMQLDLLGTGERDDAPTPII